MESDLSWSRAFVRSLTPDLKGALRKYGEPTDTLVVGFRKAAKGLSEEWLKRVKDLQEGVSTQLEFTELNILEVERIRLRTEIKFEDSQREIYLKIVRDSNSLIESLTLERQSLLYEKRFGEATAQRLHKSCKHYTDLLQLTE